MTVTAAAVPEGVVLLHGLGRTARSMAGLARFLAAAGYLTVNETYPSTTRSIAALCAAVNGGVRMCRARGAGRIHFVAHSLGGILVRSYFQDHAVAEAGRLVMLGPPNAGSEIVDRWGRAWWFRRWLGPAAGELGTGPTALPRRLKPVPLEIGVIAGTRNWEPWFARLLPPPSDGKVSLASARVAGMQDFLAVRRGHTFLMDVPQVRAATLAFLRSGRFAQDRSRT